MQYDLSSLADGKDRQWQNGSDLRLHTWILARLHVKDSFRTASLFGGTLFLSRLLSFVPRQERVGLQVDESVVLVTSFAWGMGWHRFK